VERVVDILCGHGLQIRAIGSGDVSKEVKYIILAEEYELSCKRIEQIIYVMTSKIK
jgi:hypothetical protein